MSSDKPAQSSLDSDDDLLKEDDDNICLYPDEGEEIDRRDEDRLLASDDEEVHHDREDGSRHEQYIEEPTIELMAGDELMDDSFDPIPPEESYHHRAEETPQHEGSHYTTNTQGGEYQEGEFQEDTEQATDSEQYSTLESVEPEDESESEDEEDKTRGRFKSERSNIVTITTSRSRTNIPDTLEITQEEEEKISQFMDPKKGGGRNNNRNQHNQRQGSQHRNQQQHRPHFPNQQNPRRPFMPPTPGVPLLNRPGQQQQQFWGQGRGNNQNRPHHMAGTSFPNNMNRPQQPNYQGNNKGVRFIGQGPRFRNNYPPTIFDTPSNNLMQQNPMPVQVQPSLPPGILGTPLNQMLLARENRLPLPPNLLVQGPMGQPIRQQSHPQGQYEDTAQGHPRGPSPRFPQGHPHGQLQGNSQGLQGNSQGHPRGPLPGNIQGHPHQGNSQGLPHGPSQRSSFRHPSMLTRGNSQGPPVYPPGTHQGNPQGHPRGPHQGNSLGYPQGRPQGNLPAPQGSSHNFGQEHPPPQTSRSQGHRVLINPHFRAQAGPEQAPSAPRPAWPQKEQEFGGNAGNIRNNNTNFNNQQAQFQNQPQHTQWSNPDQRGPGPVRHAGGPPNSQAAPFQQQRQYGGQQRFPNGPENIQQPADPFSRCNSDGGMDHNSHRSNPEQFSDEMDGQLQPGPAGVPIRGQGPPQRGQQHRSGQVRPVVRHQQPVRAQQSLMGEPPGANRGRMRGSLPQGGGGNVIHSIPPMQVTMVEHSGQPIQTVVGNKRPVSSVPGQPVSTRGDSQSQFSDSRQPPVSQLLASQPTKPPPKPKPPTKEELEQRARLMKRAARFAASTEVNASATSSHPKPAQAANKAVTKRLSIEADEATPPKVLKTVQTSVADDNSPNNFEKDYDRELEEKLEQQRSLREKILKQKEQRRLEVAQKRRLQLEKKLSPPGSSAISNTQAAMPVVPTTPTGATAPQQPITRVTSIVTQKQPPAPENIAQSSAPLKKNNPQLVDGFVWRSVLVKTKTGQVVRRKEKIPVSRISVHGGRGRGRGRGRGTPVSSQMDTNNSQQVLNTVSQGIQMSGVQNVEPVRTINTVGGTRPVGQIPGKRIIKAVSKPTAVSTRQVGGLGQQLSHTGPVVTSEPVGRKVQTSSRSVIAIANEDKSRRVVLSGENTPQGSSTVLIRGTSSNTTEHSIRNLTDRIGPIQTCVLDPVQRTAKVYFHNAEQAAAFRTKFNRYMLDLAMISVSLVDS